MPLRTIGRTLLMLQLLFLTGKPVCGYSVLTHEAVIDALWDTTYKPLIRKRFPQTTPEEMKEAHAYAYGGAIIQDMGYYPFGSKFFSDLVHYVRSGDFVMFLLNDAQNADELAFALGALAHYASDNIGHPEGVNVAEPLVYHKIRRKFGRTVTYEDNPTDHIRTEFGFDVLEVARGNYAPESYHDFIGFKVAKPLLERAFEQTYSIRMKDIFRDEDLALGTYRHTVSGLLPEMTKVAWAQKRDEIEKANPGMTHAKFIYNLSRAAYEKQWTDKYQKPGIGARILAFLFRIVPKIGPLRTLSLKIPPPQGETLFMKSFNDTLAQLRAYIPEERDAALRLPNMNFDTGKPTRQGDYRMADQTYEKLLVKIADKKVEVTEPLRANILEFYKDPAQITDRKAIAEFAALRSAGPAASQVSGGASQ